MEKGFRNKIPFLFVFLVLFSRQFFYYTKMQQFVVSSGVTNGLLVVLILVLGISLFVLLTLYVPLWLVFEFKWSLDVPNLSVRLPKIIVNSKFKTLVENRQDTYKKLQVIRC